MLNFENHVNSAAIGSFAAMAISEARAASIAVTLKLIRSPQLGGSQNAEKPTTLRITLMAETGQKENIMSSF